MMVHRAAGEHDAELASGEALMAAAPRNSDYPLDMYTTVSDRADALRRARTMQYISQSELSALMPLYARSVAVTRKAATLDPLNGFAWQDLAVAATFDGESEEARIALRKSIQYSKNRYQTYAWGLEMFQAKWGGQPEELKSLADEIAADRSGAAPQDAAHFSSVLLGLGFKDQAMTLHNAYAGKLQQAAKDNPGDGKAHVALADFLWDEFRRKEAVGEFKRASELMPADPAIWYAYANALRLNSQVRDSIGPYQKVVELASDYRDAQICLGFGLYQRGDNLDEAIRHTKLGLATVPNSPLGHFTLAECYANQNKPAEAVPEYKSAFQYGWRQPYMSGRYCMALVDIGQADEAVKFGKRALAIFDPGGGFRNGWPDSDTAVLHIGMAHAYSGLFAV